VTPLFDWIGPALNTPRVSLKHDRTDGTGVTGHKLAAKIKLGALIQTNNFVVGDCPENFSENPIQIT